MAGFRRAIAPADAITLRCNHSTSHMKSSVAAPQSIEIAPASEIHHVGAPNGSRTSFFGRNLDFRKFRVP